MLVCPITTLKIHLFCYEIWKISKCNNITAKALHLGNCESFMLHILILILWVTECHWVWLIFCHISVEGVLWKQVCDKHANKSGLECNYILTCPVRIFIESPTFNAYFIGTAALCAFPYYHKILEDNNLNICILVTRYARILWITVPFQNILNHKDFKCGKSITFATKDRYKTKYLWIKS